jgi:hypothetical protein
MILGITMQMGQQYQFNIDPYTQGLISGFILGIVFGVILTVIVALLATRKRDEMIRQGKYIEVDGSIKEEKANEDNPIV